MPEESGNMPQGLVDVCDSVRNLRAAQGLTLEKLAELADVVPETIKKFERYQKNWRPAKKTLTQLSLAFGLEESFLSDILAGREAKIPASKPQGKRKPQGRLEKISSQISALDHHLVEVNQRLNSMETALGKLISRVDVMFPDGDPPELGG